MGFNNNIKFLKKEIDESKQSIYEKEKKAFSENGQSLGILEQIKSEFIRLSATLAFDCDLEYEEYRDVNKMIKELGAMIEKIDDDMILIDAIKKMIVYLDLQIGSKVSFYSTFKEMSLQKELNYDYHQLKEMNLYDFYSLLTLFYEKSYTKFYKNNKSEIIVDTYNTKNNKDWFTNERIEKLVAKMEIIKKTDFENYYVYKSILEEVLSKIAYLDYKEDLHFVRKVIAYIEYMLKLTLDDKEIIVEMLEKGELDLDYKKIVTGESISLDYLKEKFNYNGKIYQKGRRK